MVKSQVETVLGAIDAKDLGITLPHEHLVMDASYYSTPPATDEERERYTAPITMQNLNWLRHNLYKSKVNVSMYNEQEAVIADLKIFKLTGGMTVVENTVIGINRDVAKMVNISKSSGVHIVCGTGYFVDETIPREVKSASVEKITENMISEISDGIKDTKVKPGIIGEVGTSWPFTDFEKRSLQAAAEAQIQTQTPVMLHPAENSKAPFEVLRLFQEAGGDAKRSVMIMRFQTTSKLSSLLTWTILDDINNGIDGTKVKPGIIGEVGCSWPLAEVENRSLRAAALAQSQTKTPVMIHPGRDPIAPFEDLRIFEEAGGDAKHTVIAHLGRTIGKKETLLELAETGVFLEYDLFGSEISYFQEMPSIDMQNDAQRIDMIGYLISQGFGDRILVAHDVHTCYQLTKYGGHGYAHILDYAVPKMRLKGISQTDIDKILVTNPKSWLTYY